MKVTEQDASDTSLVSFPAFIKVDKIKASRRQIALGDPTLEAWNPEAGLALFLRSADEHSVVWLGLKC